MLLLITASLMAGWKWEKLDTGEGPPLYDGPGDYVYDFHTAYNPVTEKIYMTFWRDQENRTEVWSFNGQNWKFECESSGGDEYAYELGSLVFDFKQQKLIDIQFVASYPTPTRSQLCAIDSGSCIDCFLEFQPVASLGSFDTNRNILVMQKTSYVQGLIEYDGSSINVNYYTLVGNAQYMEYDPILSRTVLLSIVSDKTMLYDGTDVEYLDNNFPDRAGQSISMAFFPELRGVVVSFINDYNFLFKRDHWEILNGGINDIPIAIVGTQSKAIHYFPPMKSLLLIAFNAEGQIVVYKFVNKGHVRPFNK